jgi:hypothetical protein
MWWIHYMDQVKGGGEIEMCYSEEYQMANNGKKDMTVLELCKKLQLSTMKK